MSHLNAPIDICLIIIVIINYIRSLGEKLYNISGVKQFHFHLDSI